MKTPRIDVAGIRREQVVSAALDLIAQQGLENLSLSALEKRAGMSRGQLTYYFPAKDDILLAVFDRVLELMYQRLGTPPGRACGDAGGWDWAEHLLRSLLTQPSPSPTFGLLQYTFLAQMGHREDFRQRLAKLYEEWRSNMAAGLAAEMNNSRSARGVSPRALSSVVQALLHGLTMQRAVDPDAIDGTEVLHLCLDLLGNYLHGALPARNKARRAAKKVSANGSPSSGAARARRQRRRYVDDAESRRTNVS